MSGEGRDKDLQEVIFTKAECGMPPCIASRIEQTLIAQHKSGMEAIEKLISLGMSGINREIDALAKIAKANDDELFTRMRGIEAETASIKTGMLTENKVVTLIQNETKLIKTEIVGEEGVKKLIQEDATVGWVKEKKKWASSVAVVVVATLILTALGFGMKVFDRLNMSGTSPMQQTTKEK